MVATSSNDEAIEVGHIGRQGASGMHLMLAIEGAPGRTFMQMAGSGIRVPASLFMKAVTEDEEPGPFFFVIFIPPSSSSLIRPWPTPDTTCRNDGSMAFDVP
ncbi:hypothetical protein FHT76_005664 [Rhizobium sp. BK176]|nr:hypothetical protein [Rhizobium sp. BK176]